MQRSVNVATQISESTGIGERCLESLPVKTIAPSSDVLRVNVDYARKVRGSQRASVEVCVCHRQPELAIWCENGAPDQFAVMRLRKYFINFR